MKELLFPIAINLALGLVLLALLGWKRRPDGVRLDREDEALAEFHVHFPDASLADRPGGAPPPVTLSADGRAALIETGEGLGLLVRIGRRWNARMLEPRELAAVHADGSTLELRFTDFSWPRARLHLQSPEAARSWRSRLDALRAAGTPSDAELHHA
jgi:hypothetical protein